MSNVLRIFDANQLNNLKSGYNCLKTNQVSTVVPVVINNRIVNIHDSSSSSDLNFFKSSIENIYTPPASGGLLEFLFMVYIPKGEYNFEVANGNNVFISFMAAKLISSNSTYNIQSGIYYVQLFVDANSKFGFNIKKKYETAYSSIFKYVLRCESLEGGESILYNNFYDEIMKDCLYRNDLTSTLCKKVFNENAITNPQYMPSSESNNKLSETSVYSDWKEVENTCPSKCGFGSKKKSRDIIEYLNYGAEKLSVENEIIDCSKPCPVNGTFTEWSDWGSCSKTCGGGIQSRTRTYIPAKYGGIDLSLDERNKISEEQACNTQGCPTNGTFSEWSAWGTCSKTCGGGVQTRTRTYTPATNGGTDSSDRDKLSEEQACNTQACPVTKVSSTKIMDANLHTYTLIDVKSPNGQYRFYWQPKANYIPVYQFSSGYWNTVSFVYIANSTNNAALGTYFNKFATHNSSITLQRTIGSSPVNFQRVSLTDEGNIVFENVFGEIVGTALAKGAKLNFT